MGVRQNGGHPFDQRFQYQSGLKLDDLVPPFQVHVHLFLGNVSVSCELAVLSLEVTLQCYRNVNPSSS